MSNTPPMDENAWSAGITIDNTPEYTKAACDLLARYCYATPMPQNVALALGYIIGHAQKCLAEHPQDYRR